MCANIRLSKHQRRNKDITNITKGEKKNVIICDKLFFRGQSIIKYYFIGAGEGRREKVCFFLSLVLSENAA